MNDERTNLFITAAGWLLVVTAVCVRCSGGHHPRFQDEYAPGAAAKAAEQALELQERTSASLLLLGLGSLILILQAIRERSAPPAPAEPREVP